MAAELGGIPPKIARCASSISYSGYPVRFRIGVGRPQDPHIQIAGSADRSGTGFLMLFALWFRATDLSNLPAYRFAVDASISQPSQLLFRIVHVSSRGHRP
jgi:hypothetical protein